MTLPREILTVEEALDRVLAALKMKTATEVTGRKEHYLRALSHPGKREKLTVIDLIKLDTAHLKIDGTTPIFETVGTILKAIQADMFADEAHLATMSLTMLRENSEAEIAVLEATRPDADRAAWANAEQQLAEALPVMTRILAFVRKKSRSRGPPGPTDA